MNLQQAQNKSRRFIEAAIGADSPTARGTYTNRIFNEYKTALTGMERELQSIYAKFLTKVKPEDYYNEIIKFNRLSKMQAEIRTIYNEGARAAGRGIIEASKFSITTNYYANQYAVNWFSGLEGNTYFTAIPQAAVNVSVFGTPDAWAELTKIQKAKYRNLVPPSGTLTETLLKNRVADIERINTSITQGLVNGWGYRRTAANLRAAMDTTASNALRIIRTETHRNQMAGSYLNSIEARESGIDIRRMWNATGNNTRDAHAELNGQEEDKNGMFEVDGEMAAFPGSFGVAALDINCFIGETEFISLSKIKRTQRSYFCGKVVTLKTAGGIEITGTHNHPILTEKGWIRLGFLKEGEKVAIGTIKDDFVVWLNPKIKTIKSSFADFFNSLSVPAIKRRSIINMDLNIDETREDIKVKLVKGFLASCLISFFLNIVKDINFKFARKAFCSFFAFGSFFKIGKRTSHPPNGIMGRLCYSLPFLFRKRTHSYPHNLRHIAEHDFMFSKNSINRTSTGSTAFSDRNNSLPIKISFDDIISIKISDFKGHVYNLHNKDEMYLVKSISDNGNSVNVTSGVIAHNCACYITDNVGGVPPTATAGINPVTGQREIMNFDSMPEWAKENGANVASIV